MPRKSFTPEQIIAKLRLIEVAMGSGKTAQLACKEASISEQSSGLQEVNAAVTQMDEVTQQNAALVEQAAAAAQSLQEQASGLAQIVSVFKLDSTQSIKLNRVPSIG